MAVKGTLLTLAVSFAITGFIFYALVPVPYDVEQGDDVFWIFAKRKYTRALSIIGEYLGQGHRILLTRFLASTQLLTLFEPANFTDIKVSEESFDGVPVRIYDPKNRVGNSPAFFWIHGGGWTTSSAEADEYFTTELSRRLQIPVISVNYRLAPENIFPASFDDCFTAIKHFLDNADKFGVDSTRVAIGGASAGGNLAAAVSLKLRDVKHPVRPSLQVLFVPCLQAFDFNMPSYQQNENNPFLPKYWMVNFWLWYAHGFPGHERNAEYMQNLHTSRGAKVSNFAKFLDHSLIGQKYIHESYMPNAVNFGNETLWTEIKKTFLDPYFAPLMAQELTGLPAAYVTVAGHDVLRDDGLLYAKRLSESGVEVDLRVYEHGFHALNIQFNHFHLSKRVVNDLVEYLAQKI